jgi:hypothetical protein
MYTCDRPSVFGFLHSTRMRAARARLRAGPRGALFRRWAISGRPGRIFFVLKGRRASYNSAP